MQCIAKKIFSVGAMVLIFQVQAAFGQTAAETLARSESLNLPVMIEADDIHYEQNQGKVFAAGNVEIIQGNRLLLADAVTYNKETDTVTASGHVSLMEPDGTVFFASEVELRDGLKQGVVNHFSARFKDESLIAANNAVRQGEGVTVLEQVVYSPCPVCPDEPEKKPLWQLKAREATIDEQKERVSYKHASLDVKGVPVLYTPYFSHPTPDAKRKSGLLIPKYKNDSIFGTTVTTPVYYNIAPNKDATITPSFTSDEGIIMAGEFRHLTHSGRYELSGSITNPEEVDNAGNPTEGHQLRSHIEGRGEFEISDNWSWGFNGKRASDDTYLRRYQFGDEDVLTSRVYVENIEDRNYGMVNGLSFQGLKVGDDPGATPFVLPQATYHWESDPGYRGARWLMDADALVLTRDEGVNSRRASLTGGWKVPYTTKAGHVFELAASLRGDSYWVDDVLEDQDNPASRKLDGTVSRGIPQAELNWSLPLVRHGGNKQFFLEPTANFIVSPHGGNPNKIPNEDSQDVEFSDETLFNANHFVGFDRVEGGPRTNYGLRGGVGSASLGEVNFLLGQTYRVKRERNFDVNSGLDDHFSDYVGRVGYKSTDIFDISYRFRFDRDSFSPQRNAVNAHLDLSPVQFDIDYLALDEKFVSDETVGSDRELMLAQATLDVTKSWTLSANGHRDFEDGEWISSKVNLLYDGNCVDVTLSWFEEFTRDRDIRPNTTFSLQVSLQNLGY